MDAKEALPLPVRVDLGVRVMKGYFTFPKTLELENYYKIKFSFFFRTLIEWESYPFAEVQSTLSTDVEDSAIYIYIYI